MTGDATGEISAVTRRRHCRRRILCRPVQGPPCSRMSKKVKVQPDAGRKLSTRAPPVWWYTSYDRRIPLACHHSTALPVSGIQRCASRPLLFAFALPELLFHHRGRGYHLGLLCSSIFTPPSWRLLSVKLSANSSSHLGQYLCSPAMYPCLGQTEKVGVRV